MLIDIDVLHSNNQKHLKERYNIHSIFVQIFIKMHHNFYIEMCCFSIEYRTTNYSNSHHFDLTTSLKYNWDILKLII